jgi:hypothetical protein
MTEPVPPPVAPEGEGCRRAGCGFALGVVGSALVTVGVLLLVLTRGHPLSAIAGLLGGTSTPTGTAAAVTALATPSPTGTPGVAPTEQPSATPAPTRTPTPTPTATPTPIIVLSQVNSLGRYESVEFVIQTVVDLERDSDTFWERVCGSDKLLLVAGGEVHAGFDLAKVRPGDLRVDGRSVRLILPPAEVFEYFVKEDQTQVYQRSTGLLCRPDPNLETEARRMAEERLLDYALQQGILDRAEQAGLTQLEGLLRGLGFEQVELRVR